MLIIFMEIYLVLEALTKEEIESDYEKNTGLVIIETLKERNINPMDIPGIILASHGPFALGKDVHNAVHNAVVLEEIAKMAYRTIQINENAKSVEQYLLDKHYFRKHGKNLLWSKLIFLVSCTISKFEIVQLIILDHLNIFIEFFRLLLLFLCH